ncbi:type II restriction enzyme [Thermoanaerobacter thermohydrosulfuricus]|nr:type II restriction enzyme [Thermoanaerobacter thermohydrosulfuricus]
MKKLYLEFLNVVSEEEVVEKFHDTLVDTNRGYNFFVDWNKVKKHVERYKVEINILNSLIGSKKFDDDLRKILLNYPQVLPVIPILLAIRKLNFKVIRDFADKNSDIVDYDFRVRTLTLEEVESIVEFFNKTGLKDFFVGMATRSLQDYVMGVEVGMDTHARKNRSGDAMELLLKPIVEDLALKNGFKTVLFQKKFGYLKTNYGIEVDSSIRNRKADFILINDTSKVVNIEVNFYSGTGSKPQEIVDSYIERQHELKNNGFEFIWITDGDAWRGQKNQIRKGFEKIDYLLNLHFVRIGLLEEILCRI